MGANESVGKVAIGRKSAIGKLSEKAIGKPSERDIVRSQKISKTSTRRSNNEHGSYSIDQAQTRPADVKSDSKEKTGQIGTSGKYIPDKSTPEARDEVVRNTTFGLGGDSYPKSQEDRIKYGQTGKTTKNGSDPSSTPTTLGSSETGGHKAGPAVRKRRKNTPFSCRGRRLYAASYNTPLRAGGWRRYAASYSTPIRAEGWERKGTPLRADGEDGKEEQQNDGDSDQKMERRGG